VKLQEMHGSSGPWKDLFVFLAAFIPFFFLNILTDEWLSENPAWS